jgi:hypothetical protein
VAIGPVAGAAVWNVEVGIAPLTWGEVWELGTGCQDCPMWSCACLACPKYPLGPTVLSDTHALSSKLEQAMSVLQT